MQARNSSKAFQAIARARRFSTTAPAAAQSPYRPQSKPQTPEHAKRGQSTAAAVPASATARGMPAFNRENYKDVQPLSPYKPHQEMDHSFVGMNGGEIFHEMMLRHDVKHVCKSQPSLDSSDNSLTIHSSWISWWCHSSCIRCYLQL